VLLLGASAALIAVLVAQIWLVTARPRSSRVLAAWQSRGTTFVVRDDRGWRELVAEDGRRSMVHTRVKVTDRLVSGLRYTDGFHLAVALAGPPRHTVFIGAGGAIGPRQFASFYPDGEIDAVDIDASILRAARRFFSLADCHRLRTHVGDGRAFLVAAADRRFDIVVLDAYDGPGLLVERLATAEFFAMARCKLRPGGVLCANLVGNPGLHPSAGRIAAAISAAFTGQCRVFRVPERDPSPGNCIALAIRGSAAPEWDDLSRRAEALDRRVRFAAAIARHPVVAAASIG
jgi:spermidine synthase